MKGSTSIKFFLPIVFVLLSSLVVANQQDSLDLQKVLLKQAPKINPQVLQLALKSYTCAGSQNLISRKNIITVIDYSKLSTEKRLWTFDLNERQLLFEDLVSHGKNSGENRTVHVSNAFESLMSSVGVYRTGEPYIGKNGYSLRLVGLEEGFNSNAFARAVVLHGAWYVSDEMIRNFGRIGRSWGCPAVRQEIATSLIKRIKDGSFLVVYYPDQDWLKNSRFLKGC